MRIITHVSFWKDFMSVEMMTDDGKGFARLSYLYDEKQWLLSELYVSEKYRMDGIARQIVEQAKSITCGEKIHFVLSGKEAIGWWLQEEGLVRNELVITENQLNQ